MKPLKPTGKKNYNSIPHLSSSKLGEGDYFIQAGQERILTEKTRDRHDEIFVFEKYDGSNVGIARIGNKIISITRSGYEAKTSPYKQHHYFADWVESTKKKWLDTLKDGERLAAEWMMQAHGLKYEIQGIPIVFFDHFDKDNNRSSIEYLVSLSVSKSFPIARIIHRGGAIKPSELIDVLNLKSKNIKALEDPEGMIYRVERKGKTDFLAKWVRRDFQAGKYMIGKEEKDLTYNWKLK